MVCKDTQNMLQAAPGAHQEVRITHGACGITAKEHQLGHGAGICLGRAGHPEPTHLPGAGVEEVFLHLWVH